MQKPVESHLYYQNIKMRKYFSILTPFFFLVFLSCGNEPGYEQSVNDSTLPQPQMKAEAQEPDKVETPERKIIKEGEVEFETGNMAKTASFVTRVVAEAKGYVSTESANQYGDRREQRMIIRVPANKFDWLMNKISEDAGRLERKVIEVRDVSEEYIDIAARLKTKKELLTRYADLLKRATKVDEILNIEREMGELQSEIESVEGRMNYLDDRVALSTLTVIFYSESASAVGFVSRIGDAVKNGWDGFLMFLIGLVNLWVFILIGIGLIALVRKWRERKRKG